MVGLGVAIRWLAAYGSRSDTWNGGKTALPWGLFRGAKDSTRGAYARRWVEIAKAMDIRVAAAQITESRVAQTSAPETRATTSTDPFTSDN